MTDKEIFTIGSWILEFIMNVMLPFAGYRCMPDKNSEKYDAFSQALVEFLDACTEKSDIPHETIVKALAKRLEGLVK